MTKRIGYFEFPYGKVYPPLVTPPDGAPVVPDEPNDAPEPERTALHVWGFVALLWCICHAAIIGAVIVTLRIDAEGYCTSPLQPIAAVPLALALWAVTLFMRWLAQEEKSAS